MLSISLCYIIIRQLNCLSWDELNLLRINKLNYDICIASTPAVSVYFNLVLGHIKLASVHPPVARAFSGIRRRCMLGLPKHNCINSIGWTLSI